MHQTGLNGPVYALNRLVTKEGQVRKGYNLALDPYYRFTSKPNRIGYTTSEDDNE